MVSDSQSISPFAVFKYTFPSSLITNPSVPICCNNMVPEKEKEEGKREEGKREEGKREEGKREEGKREEGKREERV